MTGPRDNQRQRLYDAELSIEQGRQFKTVEEYQRFVNGHPQHRLVATALPGTGQDLSRAFRAKRVKLAPLAACQPRMSAQNARRLRGLRSWGPETWRRCQH